MKQLSVAGYAMSHLSEFIAELLKAANRVECLCEREKLRLLGRAYVLILDGKDYVHTNHERSKLNRALDLVTVAEKAGPAGEGDVKALLLEAAETIRKIKIAADQQSSAFAS